MAGEAVNNAQASAPKTMQTAGQQVVRQQRDLEDNRDRSPGRDEEEKDVEAQSRDRSAHCTPNGEGEEAEGRELGRLGPTRNPLPKAARALQMVSTAPTTLPVTPPVGVQTELKEDRDSRASGEGVDQVPPTDLPEVNDTTAQTEETDTPARAGPVPVGEDGQNMEEEDDKEEKEEESEDEQGEEREEEAVSSRKRQRGKEEERETSSEEDDGMGDEEDEGDGEEEGEKGDEGEARDSEINPGRETSGGKKTPGSPPMDFMAKAALEAKWKDFSQGKSQHRGYKEERGRKAVSKEAAAEEEAKVDVKLRRGPRRPPRGREPEEAWIGVRRRRPASSMSNAAATEKERQEGDKEGDKDRE